MKTEWYTPIVLTPDNGVLLKTYLAALHATSGLILVRLLPGPVLIPLLGALAMSLGFHWRNVVTAHRAGRVILLDSRRCSTADPCLFPDATLIGLRVLGTRAFLRIRSQERTLSISFRRRDQDRRQWHRLALMQRFGAKARGPSDPRG